MDPFYNILVYVPGVGNPVSQSIVLTLAIIGFICYIDRNVLDFLQLVFVTLPVLGFMRIVMWVRLYPRLQWDRFQLLLRFKRKNHVTGGAKVSERHLKMAKQLMKELEHGSGQGAAGGADDSVQ